MTYFDLIVAYVNHARELRGVAPIETGEPIKTRESYAAAVSLANDRIRNQFIARLAAGTTQGVTNAKDANEPTGGPGAASEGA